MRFSFLFGGCETSGAFKNLLISCSQQARSHCLTLATVHKAVSYTHLDVYKRQALRKFTYEHGQHPHAIIVTCSDSRVIPETIFSAGLGELFVIRVAGNVIDDHQLGSIEYAAGHLGSPVVVVLGHTHCGAVDAAINSDPEGYIRCV